MRFLLVIIVVLLSEGVSNAQSFNINDTDTLSLNDCIIFGLNNNQKIKKQEYTVENYSSDKTAAIASLFPAISGSASLNANYGRSIDPATNTYTTTGNLGNNYYANAQIPLFAGFQNINMIKVSGVIKLMGLDQLEQYKDELAISIIQSFFNVIYYNSTIKIGNEQLTTSKFTLSQAKALEELGRKSSADVAQIEAQVATEELFLTKQENLYETAVLTLKQQINWPIEKTLSINLNSDEYISSSYVDADGNSILTPTIITSIVNYAIDNNPKIEALEKEIKIKKLNLQIARGGYFPSIFGSGGYNTNFYKTVSGRNNSSSETPGFWSQIKNNKGYYFGASVSIPIFNALSKRTNVHKQKNYFKMAEQDYSQSVLEIKAEIARTALEVNGFIKEYKLATAKAKAATLAYQAVMQKFVQGMVNPIDLQTSANQLLSAKAEQLNACLQLTVKSKLLDYYSGESLVK